MSSSDKLKISLQEISLATNEFAEANIIGKGGYGLVYQGQSEQHGMLAIKRLNRVLGQGDHEYGMEISLLSKYKHENLVSLIGYCGEAGEKILVYKYEANRSLDKFLHRKDLSWTRRLQICLGAARGLRYLHNETGSGHGVIHRDIKSSNILLDDNWNAKISDFGLSKIALTNSADSVMFTSPCGTMGYVDPQILYGCGITQKSDVYSFGIVMFEVLFGKLVAVPGNLGDSRFTVKMAKKHYKEKTLNMMIDPDLANEMTSDSSSMFSTIAYQCLKKRTKDRPTMSLVVKALEKALGYHFKVVHDEYCHLSTTACVNDTAALAEDAQSCCESNNEVKHKVIDQDNMNDDSSSINNTNRLCKSCGKEESCVLLLPCRHLCICTTCASSVNICPICKSTKNASVYVNMS